MSERAVRANTSASHTMSIASTPLITRRLISERIVRIPAQPSSTALSVRPHPLHIAIEQHHPYYHRTYQSLTSAYQKRTSSHTPSSLVRSPPPLGRAIWSAHLLRSLVSSAASSSYERAVVRGHASSIAYPRIVRVLPSYL